MNPGVNRRFLPSYPPYDFHFCESTRNPCVPRTNLEIVEDSMQSIVKRDSGSVEYHIVSVKRFFKDDKIDKILEFSFSEEKRNIC